MKKLRLAALLAALLPATGRPETFTNSAGMRMVRIEAGAFTMGNDAALPAALAPKPHQRTGDFDERPVHPVKITRPFFMGAFEVTNAQFELFQPEHRALRGKLGFSTKDNEAAVFVSWEDAAAFCRWLSDRERRPYRLPTEAEWEYGCRAGATTAFHTGNTLPAVFLKNPVRSWFPDAARGKSGPAISLEVGLTPPNAWGLYDMHGNVEEWTADWYGPYASGPQSDPTGRASGDFRVTRGGSHSTEPYYLRSANRMGTLPDDKSWLIGFRVVSGEAPRTEPLPAPAAQLWQRGVKQTAPRGGPDPAKPYFKGPRIYVKIPPGSMGPLFSQHNHDPAITECANGDLLAIWYTTVEESGRELALAASRLRYGKEEWDEAAPFWDAPDRNDHAPALWFDGKNTLFQFTGLSAAATWGNLAVIQRTSSDNGVTWSKARLILPEHGLRHQPVESVFRTREGFIVLPADAVSGGEGGTAIHISRDNGTTWHDAGGTIAGIHAGVVQLKDGRLMALGRGDNIAGMMPKSISADMGRTWQRAAGVFPPIGGGQRLVLMRLREGPLFLASFAKEMMFADSAGRQHAGSGLFAALSFDEGETWPVRKLITEGPVRTLNGGAWTADFILGPHSAEPKGYLSVCQSADGVIQLISSRLHYAFNLAWLKAPAPPS